MQIFNVGEIGISVVHKTGRAITQLGHKMVINIWRERENTRSNNLHFCLWFCNPSYDDLPQKKMNEKLKQGAVHETFFECSDSGWINEAVA